MALKHPAPEYFTPVDKNTVCIMISQIIVPWERKISIKINRTLANTRKPQVRFAEKATEELRKMIIENRFAIGEPLSEVWLAELLDMSRTPIREAIGELCREGLLKMIPHRGAIVAEMSLKDVKEINDLRMVLEPLAAETAISRIPEEQIEEQLKAWNSLKEQLESGLAVSASLLSELDTKLHNLILDNCDNGRLREFLYVLRYQILRYVKASWETREFVIETVDQHLNILINLRDRDLGGVKSALEDHIAFNKR